MAEDRPPPYVGGLSGLPHPLRSLETATRRRHCARRWGRASVSVRAMPRGTPDSFAPVAARDYLGHMRRTAAVAELKAQLSRFLRRVKAGDEVLVTERGVPVARIVPVERGTEAVEALRDLERQGLVRLGSGRLPAGLLRGRRPRDPDASVRRAVSADRDESA